MRRDGKKGAFGLTAPALALVSLAPLLALFVFFWRLGDDPLRQWDEAAMAINSLEMLRNGQPLVKYLNGLADLSNTKPPLANWLVAGAMALFGPDEFALRLPSAAAAFLTTMTVAGFCWIGLRSAWAGLAAALVLMTSAGFTGEHVARGGDYDSLLVLFTTVFALGAYAYGRSRSNGALIVAAAGFACALLTKGVAALLPTPGVVLALAAAKQTRGALLEPKAMAAALIAFAPIVIIYLLTERQQPGYLAAAATNDLWRFGGVVGGGAQRGFFYYLHGLVDYRFAPWVFALPLCLLIRQRPFVLFGAIYVATYLLVISLSQTKFHWYDAPIYPVAAICVGQLVAQVIERADEGWPRRGAVVALGATFLLAIYANIAVEWARRGLPYRENDARTSRTAMDFRQFAQTADLSGSYVLNPIRYNTPLLFSVLLAHPEGGVQLDWLTPSTSPPAGAARVVNCFPELEAQLQPAFYVARRSSNGACKLWTAGR